MASPRNRAARRHPELVPSRLVGIPEAADRLGITEKDLRRRVNSGEIFSLKLGRRRLIPSESLDEYIAGLVDAARSA